MEIKPIHKSTCHCGSVELELTLPDGLEDLRRCSCSMCRRRGAIVASVLLENLKVIKGEDCLSLYKFNTMTAKHYFCSKCGIYTHHQRRSNPHQFAFNVACLEGINPFELGEIPVKDGVNHPSDHNGGIND
ncbi:MAG: GFA family protein [Pseudobdellovibrionaceae bacterium]|nr:MAG: GFA family protein [Pseudobdellovibrionaceae bacterium]